MSNMIKRSLDPKGQHVSPLGTGAVDVAFENIQVKVLKVPDETAFKRMVYKATTATRGNDIGNDEFDEQLVNEAFKGGLNQCLEWDTVVFEISGVSRGLTHELVRTRKASFAQQSMRHTDMGNPAVRMPGEISTRITGTDLPFSRYPFLRKIIGHRATPKYVWQVAMDVCREAYQFLVEQDLPYQDARTVLPIATETYIIAEYPLGEFLATYSYRACAMMYPEIVFLFKLMKDELVKTAPWLEPFILISCEKTRPNGEFAHMCTFQGWERVEDHCPLAWAKENNRVWKSTKFEN